MALTPGLAKFFLDLYEAWVYSLKLLFRDRFTRMFNFRLMEGEMTETKNLLLVVATTEPANQYASYVIAFMAKKLSNVPNVTIFYGPNAVSMAKKGELAKLEINQETKELIASQIEGLAAADLPDNLEQMARFQKDQLGVTIASCATFHVLNGFADSVDDTSNIEDFIVPVKLPDAWGAINGADKVLYF